MATTTSIASKELIKYRVEDGIAIFEMDDPPANTYSYDMMQQLDTAQVLALAQQTSEASSPFQVNGGALTLTDTSDSTQAFGIDAN